MRRGETGLYLDSQNKKIEGVCAGLARWSNIPVVFWRLGFVLGALGYGFGVIPYFLLWAVMDEEPATKS